MWENRITTKYMTIHNPYMYIQYITPVYGRYMLINGDHLQARYIPLYTPLITINPPYIHYIYTGWCFFATPLKNMTSSVGMIFPNMEK